MNNWPYRPVSDFLVERIGTYKPNDPIISGYKRLEKIDFSGKIHLSDKSTKTNMIIVEPGDLVISGINVSKGALAVYEGTEPVVATIHYSSYMFDRNKIVIDFLKRFLKSPAFITELKNQVKGGIKTEIKPKHLLPLKVRVPDISDQKRVNLHFDSIENEISDLSNEITNQSSYLTQLRQAILQEAIEGKLTADLPCRQAGWRDRKFRNFSGKIVPKESQNYFVYVLECDDGSLYKGFSKDLFSRIDRHLEGRGAEWTGKHRPVSLIHYEEFETEKEAIEREKYFKSGSGREWLNEIRDQRKLDYDAEALLEKIKAEKEKLVKEGKTCPSGRRVKKQKPLAPIRPEDLPAGKAGVPFDLPEGWVWTRLGEITLFSEAGKSYKCTERQIEETEWGILKVSSTSGNYFLEGENKFYVKNLDVIPSSNVQEGDFLLSRANTKELVANSVIVNQLSKNLLLSDKTIRYHFNNSTLKHFCNYCNKLFYSRKYYILNCTGASPSMKNINRTILDYWLIPLSPLTEQQAIVERVEKLFSLVNELEKQVSERKEQSEQLMQAVLREAFEGGS